MNRQADQLAIACLGIPGGPKVGEPECACKVQAVNIVRHDIPSLEAYEGPVKHWICHDTRYLARDDLVARLGPQLEIPYRQFAARVETDEARADEMQALE